MKRVVKTPGQRYFEENWKGPAYNWNNMPEARKRVNEQAAARLGIQPITEDVPKPKTDRDKGEPLEVTADMLDAWHNEMESCSYGEYRENFAAKINAHRGVRPVPQVTVEMIITAYKIPCPMDAAIYINRQLAELAKAGKVGG